MLHSGDDSFCDPKMDCKFCAGKIFPLEDGTIRITDQTGTYWKNNNVKIETLERDFTNFFGAKVIMVPYGKQEVSHNSSLFNSQQYNAPQSYFEKEKIKNDKKNKYEKEIKELYGKSINAKQSYCDTWYQGCKLFGR